MIWMSVMCSCLILLFSYILGKCLKKVFFKEMPDFCTSVLGFFTSLGLFQLLSTWVVNYQLPSTILVSSLAVIAISILVLAVITRANLIPNKTELIGMLVGLLFCVIFFCFSLKQTLGEKPFDTVFYLSTVLENSYRPMLGKFLPYSGQAMESFNTMYDFQSYYHFHSMIMKVTRDLFYTSSEALTPLYIWNASFFYFYCLGVTTYNAIVLFVKKKNVLIVAAITLFVLVLFTNYYNIAFAFYGNTMKTLVVANILLCIYIMFKNKTYSICWLLAFLFSALIACSSSGFFMSVFLYVSLLFALIFNNVKIGKIYFGLGVAALPIAIMGAIYIANGGLITAAPQLVLPLFIIYSLFVIFCFSLRFFNQKAMDILFKIGKVIFFVLLAGLLVASLFVSGKVEAGYFYFFLPHTRADMTMNYFKLNTLQEMLRNLFLYILFAIAFINIKTKDKKFKTVLLIMIILFINPLVCPAVFTFMTNEVYCRSFELLINPVVIVLFLSYFFSMLRKSTVLSYVVAGGIGVVSLFFIFQNVTIPYSKALIPTESYDPIVKVTKSEYELYEFLNKEFDTLEETPIVISQDVALKGYVKNVNLVLDSGDYRRAPIYEEHNIPAPSELINIFFPRDYFGQEIWNNEPDYSRACPVIRENNVDYIIMSQNVTIDDDQDGTYMPFWLSVRACSKPLFENEEYVVLKEIDWAAENAKGEVNDESN